MTADLTAMRKGLRAALAVAPAATWDAEECKRVLDVLSGITESRRRDRDSKAVYLTTNVIPFAKAVRR